MFSPHKVVRSVAFFLCLTPGIAGSASKAHSTSTSRQFLVYGAEVQVRGAMCDLAERTKSHFLRLLDLRDGWRTTLVVNLDYPRANIPETALVRLDVSQLGYGLKLQLNLLLTREMKGAAVQRELLRAILIEMMYRKRGNIAAGTPYVTPPDWLVDGLLALQPGRDPDNHAELLRAIVANNTISPLEQIVSQRQAKLEAPSRQLHRAYARALVQLLLDVPGGRSKIARFITDLPDAPDDAMADLRAHFPETLGPAAAKWWALSVAQLSVGDRYETLSATDTLARLDRVLCFSIPAPNGPPRNYSLGDYQTFFKLPAAPVVLRQVSEQLLLLSARAHPSCQVIVREAYELAQLLARGKTHRVPEGLERAASHRAVVERQSSAIDDYLNWYEATQSKTTSGAFSQILETAQVADEVRQRRRDPISVYLDSLEMESN
ncbi:MAG TPA: hypothetical protein VFV83_06000 [Chthoniobacteraceae bacterium]|nr:hypothetical protein [Chthoniobacteraceae bacterium]